MDLFSLAASIRSVRQLRENENRLSVTGNFLVGSRLRAVRMPRRTGCLVSCLAACLCGVAVAVLHSANEADWHFRTSVVNAEESAELREDVREMVGHQSKETIDSG